MSENVIDAGSLDAGKTGSQLVSSIGRTTGYKKGPRVWTQEPPREFISICQQAADKINPPQNPKALKPLARYNAVYAAAKVLYAIASPEGSASAVLVAELQSGKTGAMLVSCLAAPHFFQIMDRDDPEHPIIRDVIDMRVGVLMITNKSLLSIFNQTDDRFEQAGFRESRIHDESTETCLKHSSELGTVFVESILLSKGAWNEADNSGKLVKAMEKLRDAGCKHFLFLLDEGHIGIKVKGQFNRFLENHLKIMHVTNPIDTYRPRCAFIAVTATAHHSFIFPDFENKLSIVYAPPGPASTEGAGYYGREKLLERIVDVESIESAKQIHDLIKTRAAEAMATGPKNIVCRVNPMTRKGEEEMFREAAEMLGIKPTMIQTFSSNDRNISRINAQLADPLETGHRMIIIKQALGAGITLDTIEHIGAWFDVAYSNVEATAQSIGRLCGYTPDRHAAKFPIFARRKTFADYSTRMTELSKGRLVDYISEESEEKQKKRTELVWDTPKRGDKKNWVLGTKESYLAHGRAMGYFAESEDVIYGNISANEAYDVCKTILRGQATANVKRGLIPDGPFEGNAKKPGGYIGSWNKLCQQFPILRESTAAQRAKMLFYIDNVSLQERRFKNGFKNDTAFTKD